MSAYPQHEFVPSEDDARRCGAYLRPATRHRLGIKCGFAATNRAVHAPGAPPANPAPVALALVPALPEDR